MKKTELKIRSRYDDLDLQVLMYTPEEKPKAILQMVHGMCEHKERYIPFMEFICSQGYACVMHDHRGHGASVKSQDDLGYFYQGGAEAIVDDILKVNSEIHQTFTGTPVYLFGHSMGSLAVRCYTKTYDNSISGLIVCGSPSRNPAAGVGKFLTSIISGLKGDRNRPEFIQKIAFEGFNKRFSSEGPNAWLSTDKAVVEKYNSNPLCSFQFTANGFIGLFDLMKDCYDSQGWLVSKPDLPVLFIAGEDDPCISGTKEFEDAVSFFRSAGYSNVSSRLYKGMRHEILNETDKDIVWNDILKFIKETLCQ